MHWLDSAIFYEIYPQSFRDSNADGIGDIPGIIEKLDYVKDLGCNAIWLNPCFESPFGDAGYDISDFYSVAPRYGTNADLKRLFDEAHKKGIRILLDLVAGHTSSEHPWFKESMKAQINEYTDRYVWTNSIWVKPGMNCILGISERNGVCAVNFFSHQPALNYGFYKPDKPWQQSTDDEGPRATLAELMKIMRFWLDMGCDGFRVDMASSLIKNDEDGKGNMALWRKVRTFLDEKYPEAVLVSEWMDPEKAIGGGFHMDFCPELFRKEKPYFASEGGCDFSLLAEKYIRHYKSTTGKGHISIFSGNHDSKRLSLTHDETAIKLVFAFILSMPGVPFIYYGDEIGMKYVDNLVSVEGGYGRTGSRSPMQWDGTINAGFGLSSPEKLYIPIDPDENRPTVEKSIADENSIYHEVKRLISLRRAHPALSNNGDIEFIYAEKDAYPIAYVREGGGERAVVAINPSAVAASFDCNLSPKNEIFRFGGETVFAGGRCEIPPRSAVIAEI